VGVARSLFVDDLAGAATPEKAARLSAMAKEHFDYVWRLLRRLGLSAADADDVTQQAFLVASRRLDDIYIGSERAFLYRAAVNSAYKHRRSRERRREDALDELSLDTAGDPGAEELVDRRRAREILDGIVETMPMDFRVVFVLYEIDGLSTQQIADVVGIPLGTVASRLRRARVEFENRVARLEARHKHHGEKS
jgi:RNA polymerase sigma-70 factor (ECF subfamily)